MKKKLRWGIIGTGRIAGVFAHGLEESCTGQLVAVGSRSLDTAQAFAEKHGGVRAHGSYEALLDDVEVEAVYISTPHPFHAEWAIKAAEAGKHILCEKPIGLNHPEGMAIVEAARRSDVFLMEAFMYRCHPQTAKITELVRERAIGDVQMVEVSFGFQAGYNLSGRLLNKALGGGGILDVGCYPVSMARMIAGALIGEAFDEPIEVHGVGHLGEESEVDEYAAAVLSFRSGMVAQVSCGVRQPLENSLTIRGSEGFITVEHPWVFTAKDPSKVVIQVHRDDTKPEKITLKSDRSLYALEADAVATHLAEKQTPAMSWRDTLGNMKTLDRWREAIGLIYDAEKGENLTRTVSGRSLARRADHEMRYDEVKGVGKPVSRLVMGVDNQFTAAHGTVMFDDFYEQGGNAFDTAFIYAGGKCEEVLGQWIQTRGVREDVVVIGKGAHSPYCNPAALTTQLEISLSRMQLDFVDIYMMHRDNPKVPVGEFVEVLNEHVKAGQIRAFGGSNWSQERIDEANAYAAAHGLKGFTVVSNNFSLARMVDPVWGGCVSASTAEWRAWLERSGCALFAWSSQARGFFTERAHPDDLSDPELVRCWYSEDNFRRRDRAIQMAKEKGVLPINIALAYVLSQPFPSFSLIGPRLLEETATSLPGLHVELTPEELRWLNLEDGS
jgi:predicted dehydrogenase/aryl-alcohol dehydrogenase-like predicted oxidoreductase